MSGNNEVEPDDVANNDDAAQEVRLSSGSLVDEFQTNQEQQANRSDGESVNAANDVQIAPDETRVTEDGAKDDAFVDCPDAIENSEPQMALKAKDNQQNAELKESDSMAEIEHLRHMLEQAIAERDNFAKKYEEEGKALRELHEISDKKDQEIEKYQHVEESARRILASHGASGYQEGIVDESISGNHIENAMSFLLNKYNLFLSGIDQLKQSLAEVSPDIPMQDEVEIFGTVCNNILDLNRNVVDLEQKLAQAEDGSKQLMEQLKERKAVVESENEEISELKAELEKERTRYASSKEKLSLAVTKGKALVQQRDLLKKSLAEKESELDKCMVKLNENSSALEIAYQNSDELQDALAEKDVILRKCEGVLLTIVGTDEYQSMDIIEKVRYLSEVRDESVRVGMELRKLVNALSLFEFPETVRLNGLDSKIHFLIEAVAEAQEEASKLREALNGEKDSLKKDLERSEEKVSLLSDKLSRAVRKGKGLCQERETLRKDLDEKSNIIENLKLELQEQRTACNDHRDQINRLTVDSERVRQLETDIFAIQEQKNQGEKFLAESNSMLQKVLEAIDGVGLPDNKTFDEPVEKVNWLTGFVGESQRAKIQADQDLEIAREEVRKLGDEMEEMKVKVETLKDALSAGETKISVLIHEQERLVASKAYIEKELKKAVEENSPLTNKIAEDSVSRKVLKNALQDAERNIAQLIGQKEAANSSRAAAETELMRLKEEKASREARDLANKKEDVQIIEKFLKEALSDAENKISELIEEKEGLAESKKDAEQELRREIEESRSLTDKISEVRLTKKSLEEALQAAERNISQLSDEKEAAISSRAATEIELENVKNDVTIQTSKLSEAARIKQSLEDALSQAQENLSLLAEDNKNAASEKTDLENELNRLKEEVDSHVLRFSNADSTIKSLQDSLSSAEERVSGLANEKSNAEEEISSLNLKLNACLQQLAGTHGNIESSSMELSGHLSSLRKLLKNDALSSSFLQSFEKKIGCLSDMNLLLQEVRESIIEVDSKELQNFSFAEDDVSPSRIPSSRLDFVLDVETSNGEESSYDADSIVSYIGKTVKRLQMRDKVLADKVEDFSALMDNLILSLSKKLRVVKTMLNSMPELIRSLKENLAELDSDRQALKDNISILESYNGSLLPACTDAAKQLKFEFEQSLSELKSNSHLGRLNDIWSIDLGTFDVNSVGEDQSDLDSNNYVKAAKEILFAARQSRELNRHFQNVVNKMITTIDDLQDELKESKTTSEKLLEERNLSEKEVMKLKDDLEKSENSCYEMRVSLEKYMQPENNLKEGEEVQGHFLSPSQTNSLCDKINRIDVSPSERDAGGILQFHDSSAVEKLFCIVDSYAGLKHQISLLSGEKEKLHTTIDNQVSEIKNLRVEIKHLRVENSSRSILESSPSPPMSDISEIQDMGTAGKNKASPAISQVKLAPHPRTVRKGSSDHISLNVDSDSEPLIKEEKNEDKGHVFKSLNTSGFIPVQAKMIADRVDGMWVSSSIALKNHPRARLGMITYWLLMHLWLLGSIL